MKALYGIVAALAVWGCVPDRADAPSGHTGPLSGILASILEGSNVRSAVQRPAPPDWGCPVVVPRNEWRTWIQAAARHRAPGRAAEFACELSAIARAESGWNPKARSPVGALGLVQLMPGTARDLGVDPLEPRDAIRGGAAYLAWQRSQWKAYDRTEEQKTPLAVAGYNAGLGVLLRIQRRTGAIYAADFYPHLPQETRTYVWRNAVLVSTGEWEPYPPAGWLP